MIIPILKIQNATDKMKPSISVNKLDSLFINGPIKTEAKNT